MKHRELILAGIVLLTPLFLACPKPRPTSLLPPDRITTWAPGVRGIPVRNTVCATIGAPASGTDYTAPIQNAINACPAEGVVQLSAGAYQINSGTIMLGKPITLRGAGASKTTLQRTNGAKQGTYIPGPDPRPVIIIGPSRWDSGGWTSTNLSADGAKAATSVTVASTSGLAAGQIVLLDELSGAVWQSDPQGRGQIWAAPDFRVVYQRHNPSMGTDDPWPDAAGWFSRPDRPTAETKEIASVSGNTVTFTTPLHISYRTANQAQVTLPVAIDRHTKYTGLEDVKVTGGDDGLIRFHNAAYSWAQRVEATGWLNEGFAVDRSFRIEIRDSYVHTPVWFEPGGGSYNISLSAGSSEILVENNISRDANKVMVARSAGAGSVIGYNYMDDGHIGSNPNWQEIGLNASHMAGPHHVLFEGNWGFNWDSDKTHGNSIYMTVFRNWLLGKRSNYSGGPLRAAGPAAYGYWMSFVGNVLGYPGISGMAYESNAMNTPAIFMLGWDDWSPYPPDPKVKQTVLREGNFDYVSNSVKWDTTAQTIPPSLYLSGKPAFFGANTWPWVEAAGTTKTFTLPAKQRYDGGTPIPGPTPAPSPAPTASPTPTPTPPGPTPSPTPTPAPTPTPSPVPCPTCPTQVLCSMPAMPGQAVTCVSNRPCAFPTPSWTCKPK